MISHTQKSVARSLRSRTASVIFGVFFLTPVANVAFAADAKDIIKQILDEATPQLQSTMASMSQGCHNGQGVPPLNWAGRQQPGNAAVKALSDARVALAECRIADGKQQIDYGLGQWDNLIASLHQSCSGGGGGDDPTYYGNYVQFRG
ncbi:hypothetical protein ABIC09_002313 [Bradyrhizobium sp. S3.12.5]|uniref:hypothetical protein n=1 Tax=Bradyrhizobium sp. S3.12.5 TaxID=3156386 RepID=UPI0033926AF5